MEWMERLDMDPSFADRYLNEGFSGGEKKRNEILQMAILEPELAILDETDSGLDIDALKVVAQGVQEVRARPARARRPGHHPLPAPARPPAARPSSTSSSTAASSTPAARSWPTASRPRATRRGDDRHRPSTSTAIKKDFPLLDAARSTASRSSTSTRPSSSQKPQVVLDAMDRLLRDDPRQRAPRRLRHRRGGHRALWRRPGPRSPASSARPPTAGVVFTKNVTEALNLVAKTWGRANLGAGDAVVLTQMEHHANIVPVAHAGRGDRASSCAGSGVDRRRPRSTSTDLDRLLDGAKLRQRHRHVQRARHPHPGPPARRRRPRRRGAGAWSTAAQYVPHLPTDVAELGCRLLRLHRPQDVRPDRHRRALGPRGAARGHARRSSAAAR